MSKYELSANNTPDKTKRNKNVLTQRRNNITLYITTVFGLPFIVYILYFAHYI